MINTLFIPAVLLIVSMYGWIISHRKKSKGWVYRVSTIYFLIALFLFGLRIYATHIEPHWLILRNATITTAKITKPLRILHISDIQSDTVGKYEIKVFNRIKDQQPDLILFTGDLLQPMPPATIQSELPKIAALFRTLHPPLGILGVYGNIDYNIHNIPQDMLGGLKMLEGRGVTLKFGSTQIQLFGLSYRVSMGGPASRQQAVNWFNTAPPEDITILMGHRPDFISTVKDLPIDLCLVGHSHGGQIRLPFFGPLINLYPMLRSLTGAHPEIGHARINISAGIGCEHIDGMPPLRFYCPPEMTLIEFSPR